jgi:hypothetical protein
MKDKGTYGILSAIDDHPRTVYIAETNELYPYPAFVPNTMTIYWNPNQGLIGNTGVMISPATALNHELDHGLRGLEDMEGLMRDIKEDPSNPYNNEEEERVITGSEQETAQKHGETEEGQPTRTNHRGFPYPTESPISTNTFTIEPVSVWETLFPKNFWEK